MIKNNSFKPSFIWNFHNKGDCIISLILLHTAKQNCVIKTTDMFIFIVAINNSVIIGLRYLLLSFIAIFTFNFFTKIIHKTC